MLNFFKQLILAVDDPLRFGLEENIDVALVRTVWCCCDFGSADPAYHTFLLLAAGAAIFPLRSNSRWPPLTK